MKTATHPKAQHVQNVLGPSFSVQEFDASIKTSAQAAAIGCSVAQIAKSKAFEAIWAAGGAGNAVFRLAWEYLFRLTGAREAEIAKAST